MAETVVVTPLFGRDAKGDPIARGDADPEDVSLKVIRPVFRAA